MSAINSYRDLTAWQQAMDLATEVYRHSRQWPKEELYGLTSQARRASVSIAANIAEGYGRDNLGYYIQFLRAAQGSLKELETHLLIACRVEIARDVEAAPLLESAERLGKILRGLIRKLKEAR
ncbi:MAG TPA: four helix bundle protein [Vitreimonas sp.]|uniref:four helix bundle protein n=1 Tax=Vitreimonas sp. TaxID=3069702 RepID=UPI002D5DA1CD|nr:four helix bundle protein [Vitreimonas sp.]HYD85948.1 four helix bundle protein [Vitreimonas sp.]